MNEEKIDKLDQIARRLENSGLAEYVRLAHNTKKMMFMNFLSGIARGLGFTVGTAIVLALVYKILSYLVNMNIPYLTDLFEQFVKMIKDVQ